MSRTAIAGLVGLAVLIGALVLSAQSEAAFPGKPGRIAFTYAPGSVAETSIATINPDGSGLTPLTNPPTDVFDSAPSYSPDGRRILLGRFDDSVPDFETVLMNADGSGQAGLFSTTAPSGSPAFAPDGNSFAYVCTVGGGRDICASGTDGSPLPPLVSNSGVNDLSPSYARDGRLFFNSPGGPGGDGEIFARNPDGSVAQITNNEIDDQDPNPSPDGKKVVFERGMGPREIIVRDLKSGAETNLTNTPSVNEDSPAFSPTGKQIVFRTEPQNLALVPAEGGAVTPLTPAPDFTAEPDWQPIPVKCGGKTATQVGTADKDKLVGTAGNDVIAGLGRKDKINGKGGKDRICGGKGPDTINGGKGKKDRCIGGGGDDAARGCESEKGI